VSYVAVVVALYIPWFWLLIRLPQGWPESKVAKAGWAAWVILGCLVIPGFCWALPL